MTIADILQLDSVSRNIFKKYGLDSPENLLLDFDEACQIWRLNAVQIKRDLINLRSRTKRIPNLSNLLRKVDEQRKRIKIDIEKMLEIVRSAGGFDDRFETTENDKKLNRLVEGLEIHFYKEEVILFPQFEKLLSEEGSLAFCLKYPVECLEIEHQRIKSDFEEIKELIQQKIQLTLIQQYKELSFKIDALERDVMHLARVEDELLFPAVLCIENARSGPFG